jgi:hypothetical protein
MDERFCDECEHERGYRVRHGSVFVDSATGRSYRTEHVLMFATG